MSGADLLPHNATPFERAMAGAMDVNSDLWPEIIGVHSFKYYDTPAEFLPFMAYEFGLGPISKYFTNLPDLIEDGVDWQRVRGTLDAVDRALEWIGYTAEEEEAPWYRAHWNRFQLHLDRVRDAETPDLDDIAFLAGESVPLRSKFVRGFHGYDFRAAESSRSRLGSCLLSNDSGVRLKDNGPRWSFGRPHDHDATLTEAALRGIGVWEEFDAVIPDDVDPELPAFDPGDTWADVTAAYRLRNMAWNLAKLPCWVEFSVAGTIIGLRRARTVAQVIPDADGPLVVGSQHASLGSGHAVYVEAQTDFGDGDGQTAILVGLRFGAAPSSQSMPGLLWTETRAELDFTGPPAALHGATIEFGKTVRERVRTLVRIA